MAGTLRPPMTDRVRMAITGIDLARGALREYASETWTPKREEIHG